MASNASAAPAPRYGMIMILDAIRDAVGLTKEHLVTVVGALVISIFVAVFTGGFLAAALMLSVSRLCLRIVDGEDGVQSNEVLSGIKDLVVPGFLLSILPLVGTAACVGGLVVMVPVMVFASFLRADHPELTESALLKESWNAISDAGLFKWLFMQLVLLPLVVASGLLGCGIGVFATFALAIMVNACAFRQVFPKNVHPAEAK